MRKIIELLFVLLLRLLAATWRIAMHGSLPNDRCVIVFWHGAMLPAWKYFANSKAVAVVSRSRDGDILSTLLKGWNYRLIRGSSSTGGRETLKSMTDFAANTQILITPDGPRGPKCQTKAGAIIAAQLSGSPLACCNIKISRKIILKSWDSFAVPLPFAKIDISAVQIADASSISVDEAKVKIQSLLGEWP